MEPQFKTSFIPKKTISTQADFGGVKKTGGMSFFVLISIVLFLASILFAGLAFAWKITLENQIGGQIEELQQAQDAFDPNFIAQATRLNARILAANKLLNNHVSPSSLFELLEDFTLQTISLRSMEFSDNQDEGILVNADGIGKSFESVVLQSDEYGKSGYMRDVIFSDVQRNTENNAVFSFQAKLEPKLILYRNSLSNNPNASGDNSNSPEAVNQSSQSSSSQSSSSQSNNQDDLGVFGGSSNPSVEIIE